MSSSSSDLRSALGALVAVAACVVAGCEPQPCIRHSDCSSPYVCALGECVAPEVGEGGVDGGGEGDGGMSVDAAMAGDAGAEGDAAVDEDVSADDAAVDSDASADIDASVDDDAS